jgi:hypothetical protein
MCGVGVFIEDIYEWEEFRVVLLDDDSYLLSADAIEEIS